MSAGRKKEKKDEKKCWLKAPESMELLSFNHGTSLRWITHVPMPNLRTRLPIDQSPLLFWLGLCC